jgi:D-tyrosyl-tRNA(Tyr) deacylase
MTPEDHLHHFDQEHERFVAACRRAGGGHSRGERGARSSDGPSDQAAHTVEVEGLAALFFEVTDSEDPIEVGGVTVGAIGCGLVAFVGVGRDDTDADVVYTAGKLAGLRVFTDATGKLSKNVADVFGELLVISQFTLFGDVRRGLRPSFDAAMEPREAERLYERFVSELKSRKIHVETGQFRADMRVAVDNDGPITILVDSKRGF